MIHFNVCTTIILSLFILDLISEELKAMQYQEPLNDEDLHNLFSEDGCVEGSLSTAETGGPVIHSVSFTDLKQSDNSITNEQISGIIEEKSPMSLVSELAVFNKIKYQYILTEEEGPAHKKKFGISLELGKEQYYGRGNSIKKAQHEAARLAMNSTSYEHPPIKPKNDKTQKVTKTPVEKLHAWAGKNHVTYSFIQQIKSHFSSNHKNNYHKSMYSKGENVHKVTVKIGEEEFNGEGLTLDLAKQNAASVALKGVQSTEGFCMFDDSERNLFSKIFNSDSGNYSPISLVHEFASKTKLPATFDLISEEGPAHIKKFVYKCSIADRYETFGEGSNKKVAKTQAAENMIKKLKSDSLYNPTKCGDTFKKKKKKTKVRNLIKSAVKSHYEEETDFEYSIPDDIDPISKLMQIQQGKHDIEPIFSLLEEKENQANKEFFIEVVVGELTFIGSGPNKKTAKRKAAEGMLEKLGYSTVSGKTRFSSSDHKRKQFIGADKKSLVPGLTIDSDKFIKLDDVKSSTYNQDKLNEYTSSKDPIPKSKDGIHDNPIDSKQINIPSNSKPKKQLLSLAQELGFKFQFSDFPTEKGSGFVTLVSLTTDPPKVCYGIGLTTEQSQDKAALTALGALYKSQLESISRMLHEPASELPSEKDFYIVDDKSVINAIEIKETE